MGMGMMEVEGWGWNGGSPSGHTGVFKQAAGPHIAHIVHQPSLSERKRMEDLQRSKTGLQDSSSALSLSSPNLWVQLNAAPPIPRHPGPTRGA